MTEELNEKYNNFHDDIILNNYIDFENRKTTITIKNRDFEDYEKGKIYKLEFQNVELQHFEFLKSSNILFGISLYKNYQVFEYSQSEYLTKIKGYFDEEFEKIKKNESIKFYYITSVNNGLEGFIICEKLAITELKI